MLAMERAYLNILTAVVIAASCSSKSSGGSSTGGGDQAALDACRQLHQAVGQTWAACFGGPAAEWQAYWDEVVPCAPYGKHVADGTVMFDAAAVPGCVAEIHATPCGQYSSCEYTQVFVGGVADGMPCSDHSVCGPRSGCMLTSCDGTCRATGGAALGEPCATVGCEQGLSCDSAKDVCVANAPAGGPCGGPSSLQCASGLYCKVVNTGGSGALSGTCTPVSSGPCTQDSECAFNEFCYQGACKPRLALGAPCGDARTGCTGFSECDTTSAAPTCVHAGLRGERCARIYGSPAICINGSVCGLSSTCVARGQVGDACDAFSCAAPLLCSGTCFQCPSPDAGQP